MENFWKTVAIGSILLLVLAAGIGIVMAQDDGTAPPPVETDPADEGEDDAWSPRGWFGHSRGMMGQWDDSRPLPEEMPFGHHGMFGRGMFGSSSSLLDILAEQLGLTVDEVVDELSAGITIADLAANHDVDLQVIVDAFLAAHQEALSAAVEDGRLTQEQAEAMQEHMAEEIAERVNEPWTGRMGPGMGFWGDPDSLPEDMPFGRHGMFGRGVMMGGASLLEILAEQLGLTVDEVADELSAGITIADLAANHNVDLQVIVDAFLTAHQEALSAAVEDGRLTQEQADAMQEHMAEEIAERVNEPWTGSYGPRGGFPGGCGGGMGGRWNGGGANEGAAPMRGLSTGSSL